MWSTDADAQEGCVWPIAEGCCNATFSEDIIATAEQFAIDILYAASGRKFGQCWTTVRPCPADAAYCDLNMWDLIGRNTWLNQWPSFPMGCGVCTKACTCESIEAFRLPSKNVREIRSVVIDGVVLEPTSYRLDGNMLIRLDGEPWPNCQDLNVDPGEVGSWEVTYLHGRPVPIGGQIAAGHYACEIAKSLSCDESCMLPERVQTVTRQGVTVGFMDPMTFLADGLTGIYLVDVWLRSVNPHGNKTVARVRAPGQRKTGRLVRSHPGS